jgi:hypothetical protein
MKRRDLIMLLLGLIDGQKTGAVKDTLWMHGSQETIWEALLGGIFPDDNPSTDEVIDAMMTDPEKLERLLQAELAKENAHV